MSFEKINEELLLDIFHIASPSKCEEEIGEYIIKKLTEMGVSFTKDKSGNIYNLDYPNKPLLNAHMDTVQKHEDVELARFIRIMDYEFINDKKEKKNIKILRGCGVLGGDDKCGVYIILEILSKYKEVNFIFSVGEEIGCTGITALMAVEENKKKMEKMLYGLTLDRRYAGNIICKNNSYGTQEFQDAIQEALKDFGYKPETGSCSDANHIKEVMSCCNLSVGYYEPHSTSEYVILRDLLNTLNGVEKIITTMTARFDPIPVTVTKYNKKLKVTPLSTYCRKCESCGTTTYFSTILGKDLCYDCAEELSQNIDSMLITDKHFAKNGSSYGYYDKNGKYIRKGSYWEGTYQDY